MQLSAKPIRRLATTFILAIAALSATTTSAAEKAPPNFVIILIDDLGWSDLGCYGSPLYETPHIDSLAARGMKFDAAYASCPVCSPTRASIMTGKYPARLQLTNFLVGKRQPKNSPILTAEYIHQLPLEETTLAEALKSAGYVSGHIGKWHLGGGMYQPENQGFAFNFGGTHSGMPRAFFYPQWKGNPPVEANAGDYLPDVNAQQAVDFIQAHKDQPFFLYLSHYAVHIPIQGKEDKVARYREKLKTLPADAKHTNPIYAAMVESVDDSVGRVLQTLEELNLADNTVVLFTSDNGGLATKEGPHTPATSNAPLKAGKGYLYEGGIREPLLVVWPGKVKPNSTCDVPVSSVDFFPTFVDIAGVEADPNNQIDGVSLRPLLEQTSSLDREALYWHYPHFSNQGGKPGAAIRQGNYKLIERYEDNSLELYDLAEDPSEETNLAPEKPDLARSLQLKLAAWRTDVNANMPKPNPDAK